MGTANRVGVSFFWTLRFWGYLPHPRRSWVVLYVSGSNYPHTERSSTPLGSPWKVCQLLLWTRGAGHDRTGSMLSRCPGTDHSGRATHPTQLYAVEPGFILTSARKKMEMMIADIQTMFAYRETCIMGSASAAG